MKHIPFWIVSWAASAVLLTPLFGWERPEHALAAVNVYAWFLATVFTTCAVFVIFSRDLRKQIKAKRAKRNGFSRLIGALTAVTFMIGTAYVGWIGLFGAMLISWLLEAALTAD